MKIRLIEPTLYENRRIEPGVVDLPAEFIKDNPSLFKPLKKKEEATIDEKIKEVSSGDE